MKINYQQKNISRETLNLSKGFTLVETLVAISIFSISILGLMSVLASSISNTTYAKTKITASYLAQEGIEYIRNMRDTYVLYTGSGQNWNTFRASLTTCNAGGECGFNVVFPFDIFKCNPAHNDCKLYLNNGSYSVDSSGGVDSGFVRKIWVEVVDQDKEIKVFSKVSWTQGSGDYNVTFSENLFKWAE